MVKGEGLIHLLSRVYFRRGVSLLIYFLMFNCCSVRLSHYFSKNIFPNSPYNYPFCFYLCELFKMYHIHVHCHSAVVWVRKQISGVLRGDKKKLLGSPALTRGEDTFRALLLSL